MDQCQTAHPVPPFVCLSGLGLERRLKLLHLLTQRGSLRVGGTGGPCLEATDALIEGGDLGT